MKININFSAVKFSDLEQGHVFMLDNKYYMKITEYSSSINAVELESGDTFYITHNYEVIPINGVFRLELS